MKQFISFLEFGCSRKRQIKADFAGNNKKIRSAPRGEVWAFYFVKIELAFKVPVFGSEVLD